MPESDDHQLLREFAQAGSETAFGALVARYVNLVYSAAVRSAGNPHDAEEITQAVFIILACKAGNLSPRTILSGWLYQTTQLTAANLNKTQGRRQRREQEAYMQSTLDQPEPTHWEQLAPLLEEAMGRLDETDRTAIVLHYFEKKTAAQTAIALRSTEAAVYKRTRRALEKLRNYFAKHGVTSTASGIADAISANSVQLAPVAMAKSITAIAITKGAAASTSTLALIKGALKIMAWSNFKTAIVVGVGVIVLLAAGTAAIDFHPFASSNEHISFVAEGTEVYELGPNYPNHYRETRHFIATRKGNLWIIRTIMEKQERSGVSGTSTSTNSIDDYEEMSFDGKNIYTLEQRHKPQPANFLGAMGRVEPTLTPPGEDTYQIFPVWLAYCSAPYFENLKTGMAVSFRFRGADFLDSRAIRSEIPAKWTMYGSSFVNDISWMSDGTFTGTDSKGKIVNGRYPPPYDKGFVEGQFQITSWTNWNGILIPAGFRIEGDHPSLAPAKKPILDTSYTITGTLDQIKSTANFSPVPELSTKTYITDWRLKDHKRFHNAYITTNQWDVSSAIY